MSLCLCVYISLWMDGWIVEMICSDGIKIGFPNIFRRPHCCHHCTTTGSSWQKARHSSGESGPSDAPARVPRVPDKGVSSNMAGKSSKWWGLNGKIIDLVTKMLLLMVILI